MPTPSDAINFLNGAGNNSSGYSLEKILLWDDDSWENEHDFIQWLFPIDTPSNFNPDSPVLNAETVERMRKNPNVKKGVLEAYERFLGFCGLIRGSDGLEHKEFKRNVWEHENHNWLRITRVLRCLSLLELHDEANELLSFVSNLPNVNAKTMQHWKNAVKVAF